MYRKQIKSSHLVSVGYDENKKILEIEFNDGAVYQYFDVPRNIFTDLFSEPSAGKYARKNVFYSFHYEKLRDSIKNKSWGGYERNDKYSNREVETMVTNNPPLEDIINLYRVLAKKYHPDLYASDGLMMKKINKLYKEGDLEGLLSISRL